MIKVTIKFDEHNHRTRNIENVISNSINAIIAIKISKRIYEVVIYE